MLQVRARGGLACDVLVNGGLSGSKEADFLADAVGLAWPFRTGDRRAASGSIRFGNISAQNSNRPELPTPSLDHPPIAYKWLGDLARPRLGCSRMVALVVT